MSVSFTALYLKHHSMYSYNPLFSKFVQINCPDISRSKSRFPDKNNLFACVSRTLFRFLQLYPIFIWCSHNWQGFCCLYVICAMHCGPACVHIMGGVLSKTGKFGEYFPIRLDPPPSRIKFRHFLI